MPPESLPCRRRRSLKKRKRKFTESPSVDRRMSQMVLFDSSASSCSGGSADPDQAEEESNPPRKEQSCDEASTAAPIQTMVINLLDGDDSSSSEERGQIATAKMPLQRNDVNHRVDSPTNSTKRRVGANKSCRPLSGSKKNSNASPSSPSLKRSTVTSKSPNRTVTRSTLSSTTTSRKKRLLDDCFTANVSPTSRDSPKRKNRLKAASHLPLKQNNVGSTNDSSTSPSCRAKAETKRSGSRNVRKSKSSTPSPKKYPSISSMIATTRETTKRCDEEESPSMGAGQSSDRLLQISKKRESSSPGPSRSENDDKVKTKGHIKSPSMKKARSTTQKKLSLKPPSVAKRNDVSSPTKNGSLEDMIGLNNVKSLDLLRTLCWVCHTSLQTSDDNETCFYAMHAHPLLEVPTCSVCSEVCYEVETRAALDDKGPDCCSGCGGGDDDGNNDDVNLLLLCDSCPRAFCLLCVAQAHGGGPEGNRVAQDLADDDSAEWHCLACSTPPELSKLQQALIQEDEGSSVDTENQEPLETLKKDLLAAEAELDRCYSTDNEEYRQKMKANISQELSRTCSDENELQELVNVEMELLEREWKNHHARVADNVTTLQDKLDARLQAECGVSVLDFYKSIARAAPVQDETWRIKADEEMDKRYREADANWKKFTVPGNPTGTSMEVYKKKNLCDAEGIEDINTVEDFKSALKEKVDAEELDEALQEEEKRLQEQNVAIKSRKEDDDTAELQRLQRKTVSGGGRVRRDALLLKKSSATTNQSHCALESGSPMTPGSSKCSSGTPTKRISDREKKRVKPFPASGSVLESRTRVARSDSSIFCKSDLILTPAGADRTVSVAPALAGHLKKHQVEGIKFMWGNACSDLATFKQDQNSGGLQGVGGCILAHHMGLGKSLQAITLLHTLLHHPSLAVSGSPSRPQLIQTALLVVPTNTLKNWENEFDKWVGNLHPPTHVFNLNSVDRYSRLRVIKDWHRKGGVLLVTKTLFSNCVKSEGSEVTKAFQEPGPDVVILDEAHTMIRNPATIIYKVLKAIKTKRRIALTGTPLQNNLIEYYHMASWVRPGCLGTESSFERSFADPIKRGMASDSLQEEVALQRKKSRELHATLSPFVHRRDSSVLKEALPPMQQAVLHLRQTKLQHAFYRYFSRHKKEHDLSILEVSNMLRPVHNHPGCLLMRRITHGTQGSQSSRPAQKKPSKKAPQFKEERMKQKQESPNEVVDLVSDSDESVEVLTNETSLSNGQATGKRIGPTQVSHGKGDEGVKLDQFDSPRSSLEHDRKGEKAPEWWEGVAKKKGYDQMTDIGNGNKAVLLLEILAHAYQLGEKVVIFSQCLKTLDFIELVLMSPWKCPGTGKVFGPWRKNTEVLRIDGNVNPSERGNLISTFNCSDGSLDAASPAAKSKVFLISLEAGGIGINLTAASRVILFDSHWNPAVMSQALSRCYRYGQTKPVYAYRFVTEGSLEEKIYSRSVNKSSLAARIIDLEHPENSFSTKELDVLLEPYLWCQCDRCNKWRMLPPDVSKDDLPDKWFCEMNEDKDHSTCDAQERSQEWYAEHFANTEIQSKPVSSAAPDEAKTELMKRDEILCYLLGHAGLTSDRGNVEKEEKQGQNVISKYYFHDSLLEDRGLDIDEDEVKVQGCAESHDISIDSHVGGANKPLRKLQSPGEPTASPVRNDIDQYHDATNKKVAGHAAADLPNDETRSCVETKKADDENAQHDTPSKNVTPSLSSPSSRARRSFRQGMQARKSTTDSESVHLCGVNSIHNKARPAESSLEGIDVQSPPICAETNEIGKSNEYAIEILSDSETD